jgi:hypothetical protein
MKARACVIAASLFIGPSGVGAQTTNDAIDAWTRGDFERAVEIFQPLAGPAQPDPAAAFFLGTMYETGSGVPRDIIRACALYQRVEDTHHLLFRQLATGRILVLRETLDIKQLEECDLRAAIGFDHDFQRLTFSLGPGHFVTVDITGATITYEGKESHIDIYPRIPGIVFLPVRHTELTAGVPRASQRHFLEFFTWEPAPGGTWSLNWLLFEVLRDDLFSIAGEALLTATSPQPRSDVDISGMTRIRVNSTGDAEWAAMVTGEPRLEFIPTEAERLETDRRKAAREAAERAVDWNRVRDLDRAPVLTYSDGDGCAHLFVYGWTADRSEVITMRADRQLLGLSINPRTFDLASPPAGFELLVHVYGRPLRSWPFCTDLISNPGEPSDIWRAIGGSVTIELSAPSVRPGQSGLYRVTIRIVGAEFVNTTGGRVKQPHPITLTAMVGSFAG